MTEVLREIALDQSAPHTARVQAANGVLRLKDEADLSEAKQAAEEALLALTA